MSKQTKKIAKPHILILILLSGLSPIALNIFLPSMPSLTENLNTNYTISQLTLTLYLAALAFGQLVLGPLSDKYGRRPVLLMGVALFAVASFGCAFAFTIEQLIFGRILQAIGGCAGVVITRAIVRDLYDRDRAASLLGYMTMFMAILPLLAPIIGGYIDQYASWRESFYLISLIGIFAYFISHRKLHETNHNPIIDIDINNIFSKYAALLREKQYMAYVLGMAFCSAVFYAFIAGAPFFINKILDLSPSTYGFYFVLVSTGYMSGNFLSGKFSVKLGNRTMLMISTIILAIGIVLLIFFYHIGFDQAAYLFVPMMFVACSNGIAIPNAMAGALSIRPDIAGTASGFAGFLQVALGAITTAIVGFLHDGSVWPMIICMVITAIIGMLCFQFLDKKQTVSA